MCLILNAGLVNINVGSIINIDEGDDQLIHIHDIPPSLDIFFGLSMHD